MMHKCPVPGCTRLVPSRKVMCYEHWQRVSRQTRAAVYEEWAKGLSPAYLAARARSIAEATGAGSK